MIWAHFHCCEWPNIEKAIWPSGHTGWVGHCSTLSSCNILMFATVLPDHLHVMDLFYAIKFAHLKSHNFQTVCAQAFYCFHV